MAGIDAPEQDMLAGSAARFLATAQALTDDDLHHASALPGWTRAHVLTHLAQGADSRTGLLRAARAGRVGRQYPSEQARAEAIDAGARRSPTVIRADLQRAVHDCLTAIRQHPRHRWDAPAITLAAGPQPVRDVVPSLRRELEYHHVDLAAGYQPADWPDDFAATELSLVTAWMNRRADAPPMTLTGPCALRIDTSPPVDVTGPPPALLAWLTGRSNGSGLHPDPAALPTLPPLGLARPRARVPGTMASVARGGEKRSALQRRRPFLISRRSPLLALGDHYATFRDDHEWRGMRRAALPGRLRRGAVL